jgi:hypothetical protein
MTTTERLGHDGVSDRDLFLLALPRSEDLPGSLSLATSRFVCLLAWDARAASTDEIATLARRLLNAGAVYVCAWGPDCERVHDIIDKASVGPNPDSGTYGVVMTTWHDSEPLAEVLGFVLTAAWPDEAYEDDCGCTIGIAIGSPQWTDEIRAAFSNPHDFVRQLDPES